MSFALLAIPGCVALIVLVRLRLAAPDPAAYDPTATVSGAKRLRLGRGLPPTFWLYASFSAATMFGFATWGVLAYHLVARDVVSEGMVPVLYAGAMGAAALTAVASGRAYDRVGMRGLVVLPALGVLVPLLSFRTSVWAVVAGAVVWGAAMGIHDSTMRAAVTDLVAAGTARDRLRNVHRCLWPGLARWRGTDRPALRARHGRGDLVHRARSGGCGRFARAAANRAVTFDYGQLMRSDQIADLASG